MPKPLLASRVPYKHAHLLAGGGASTDKAATFIIVVGVDVDSLDFEVPAESGLGAVLGERLLDVALNERCFSSHRLAHANDFKLLKS